MEEKDALEYLANLANTANEKKITFDKYGSAFLIGDDVHPWHPDTNADEELQTHTLQSVVDYAHKLPEDKPYFIHVVSPTLVRVRGFLNGYGERNELLIAQPWNIWDKQDEFFDREQLNIMLQSMFVDDEETDKAILLKFIGNLREENAQTASDDGITQKATMSTGIASQDTVIVPNPVNLRPFRTFTEVKQPESQFVFRMKQGMQGALFESDGSAWKNEAIDNIKTYLNDNLSELENITILG
ncbi:hypothetical protein IWT25_02320 [Secundilactobacillus pentosiphilus]|uniref:Phage protein n=1 Tax=Secundilactobacillus pentosiphilus TaxID=1714682 RepID=A0A1Z5IZH3_9LACO|nr:hypothetical protein [Secundilactobacillus pentosiphilus]GAX06972.1 hypothetical protein IWT25_02320 [Secundilactobacillus pentosiphilus]